MMMKNIFKTLILSFALVCGLTSCNDEMDGKDGIDAAFASKEAPTLSTNPATINGFSGFTITGTVSSIDQVLEVGVMLSSNADFTTYSVYAAQETATSFTTTVDDLKDDMTYYVRAYAYTKGAGTIVSEVQKAVLPKAPDFQDTYLFGSYAATDIDLETEEPSGSPYTVKIAQKGDFWNKITISNIWDGGLTIEGTVDFEKKTITTKDKSVIYVHADYGDTWAWGLKIEDGKIVFNSSCITVATYDDKGNIHFGNWAAKCAAGEFGLFMTEMVKQ